MDAQVIRGRLPQLVCLSLCLLGGDLWAEEGPATACRRFQIGAYTRKKDATVVGNLYVGGGGSGNGIRYLEDVSSGKRADLPPESAYFEALPSADSSKVLLVGRGTAGVLNMNSGQISQIPFDFSNPVDAPSSASGAGVQALISGDGGTALVLRGKEISVADTRTGKVRVVTAPLTTDGHRDIYGSANLSTDGKTAVLRFSESEWYLLNTGTLALTDLDGSAEAPVGAQATRRTQSPPQPARYGLRHFLGLDSRTPAASPRSDSSASSSSGSPSDDSTPLPPGYSDEQFRPRISFTALSPDGKTVIIARDDGQVVKRDVASGKESPLPPLETGVPDPTRAYEVSKTIEGDFKRIRKLRQHLSFAAPDSREAAELPYYESEITRYRAYLRGQRPLSDELFGEFTPDGKRFLVTTADGDASQYILQSSELRSLGSLCFNSRYCNPRPSINGNEIRYLTNQDRGRGVVFKTLDLQTGATTVTPVVGGESRLSEDGQRLYRFEYDGQQTDTVVEPLSSLCVPDTLQVVPADCNCSKGETAPGIDSAALDGILMKQLCDSPYDRAEWERKFPPVRGDTLDETVARIQLMKFQKTGGFVPENDLRILLAILRSDIPKESPDLLANAMQGVLNVSPILYESLLQEFPTLKKVPPGTESGAACRSPEENKETVAKANQYLEFLNLTAPHRAVDDWKKLRPLTSALSQLPADQRDEEVYNIATTLSLAAVNSAYRGVFDSKLCYFLREAIKPIFGVPTRRLTDLAVAQTASFNDRISRKSNRMEPIILGTQPITLSTSPINGTQPIDRSASEEDQFGIYSSRLKPIDVSDFTAMGLDSAEANTSWTQGDQTFHAKMQLRAEPLGDIIPVEPSPRYSELWKDGNLTGLVMTGSNLAGIDSGVLDEYVAYYQENGFTFDSTPTDIPNTKTFLSDQIKAGKLGYFIKEAHSDGDERNLFRVNRTSKVLTGTKTLPDGRKETIYVLYPGQPTNSNRPLTRSVGDLISNEEFGSWMQERPKDRPFVYFNTSCWSATKALYEIPAAKTKSLVEIASDSELSTFSNTQDSALQITLSGFRAGKTYAEIRKDLEQSPGYVAARDAPPERRRGLGDHYIFPDEPDYDQAITKLMAGNVSVKVAVTDPDGKPYNIEGVH